MGLVRRILAFCCALPALVFLQAKTPPRAATAKALIRKNCTQCHNVNVVYAQRLTRREWEQELAKMAVMGAKIENPAAMLDYLAKYYGPSR